MMDVHNLEHLRTAGRTAEAYQSEINRKRFLECLTSWTTSLLTDLCSAGWKKAVCFLSRCLARPPAEPAEACALSGLLAVGRTEAGVFEMGSSASLSAKGLLTSSPSPSDADIACEKICSDCLSEVTFFPCEIGPNFNCWLTSRESLIRSSRQLFCTCTCFCWHSRGFLQL